ncbi:MAG: peptidase M48 [Comamonas sp. SCN 65-56]|uniref:M48 family metalloprotease n=1 Tax=Comamonas sp. SCN 65-56 TaxID=1660095 RepID=UPI00086E7FBF|nr:M48 family metalloprotease [Comamonas sp. SCN 65-56]ODS92330.1 MAG: peptidase M48 [Comamonas sp. SCN 65-56]
MKRVAFKRWLALGACAALLAGCETMPSGLSGALGSLGGGSSGGGVVSGVQNVVQGASAAFKDYSPQEERELGSGFASVLLGARPLLRNDELQRYVNRVGLWVAGQTDPRKDGQGKPASYDWRFGVIDSDAVNAYATPGGYVFVTKGLLLALNSEAELAGVLGHEITHVLHGHYLSAVKKGGFAQIAGGIVEARSGNSQLSGAMINMVRNIYAKGLDQSDEYDADRYGMLWAARAGYAPAGLMQSLRVVAGGSAQDANYQLLLATHPPAQERIARLEPLMNGKFSGIAGASNEQRYLAMRRVLR